MGVGPGSYHDGDVKYIGETMRYLERPVLTSRADISQNLKREVVMRTLTNTGLPIELPSAKGAKEGEEMIIVQDYSFIYKIYYYIQIYILTTF